MTIKRIEKIKKTPNAERLTPNAEELFLKLDVRFGVF